MNPLQFKYKETMPILLPALVLACFALSPKVQAVSPAPDGGYPGFNTAEGQSALLNLTTGQTNTALGAFSLGNNTTRRLEHCYRQRFAQEQHDWNSKHSYRR